MSAQGIFDVVVTVVMVASWGVLVFCRVERFRDERDERRRATR